jgi:hypothetical protein
VSKSQITLTIWDIIGGRKKTNEVCVKIVQWSGLKQSGK